VDPENEQGLAENVRRKFPRTCLLQAGLGTEKISRNARITAGLKLREAARVFFNVPPACVGRKPSWRTGSRNALVFLWGRGVPLVAVAAGITLS
jgi:hypothetical protein